jgi:hypothetical protein
LELTVADGKALPFKEITPQRITAEQRGNSFEVKAIQGSFVKGEGRVALRMIPSNGSIVLDCDLSK